MKIYNKKNFLSGLFLLLLGIGTILLSILQEFTLKSSLLSVLCLYFGIGVIFRSISREKSKEDLIDAQDERNQLINLKSRSKSFSLTQGFTYLLMLIFFSIGKLLESEMIFYMGVGFAFSFSISLITEICTTIYYENRN